MRLVGVASLGDWVGDVCPGDSNPVTPLPRICLVGCWPEIAGVRAAQIIHAATYSEGVLVGVDLLVLWVQVLVDVVDAQGTVMVAQMSSSFVKDCSDVSAPGNTSSGKTVIIIVNNETGNVSLDGSELQNLLASHGADGSQVSVVRMGNGAQVNVSETAASTVTATADGAQHVNLTVEGFPGIPVEGVCILCCCREAVIGELGMDY
ncbi:hypothetical protein E2C01_041735 [Portunus trituberculatus]|uniref:Uncharacterized protein n=1 Tax=Portunus trituberculatus TaxID=210409 RepID=A0A5B7FUI7_PORTR|nr:hypothetical protein [Portunus trituberculatus]